MYFLDAISMEAEQIAGSFEEFFRDEFLRCSIDPYDRRLVTAAQTFGPLDWKEHLVYVPSILITGDETASSVEKMSARASMIVNGDLARQLGHSTFEREMAELEEYTDERGRTRVRVIWAS